MTGLEHAFGRSLRRLIAGLLLVAVVLGSRHGSSRSPDGPFSPYHDRIAVDPGASVQ